MVYEAQTVGILSYELFLSLVGLRGLVHLI